MLNFLALDPTNQVPEKEYILQAGYWMHFMSIKNDKQTKLRRNTKQYKELEWFNCLLSLQ